MKEQDHMIALVGKKKELQALTCTVEMDTAGKGLSMSKKKKELQALTCTVDMDTAGKGFSMSKN